MKRIVIDLKPDGSASERIVDLTPAEAAEKMARKRAPIERRMRPYQTTIALREIALRLGLTSEEIDEIFNGTETPPLP